MNRFTWIISFLFAVMFVGTFPTTAKAQSPDTAVVSSESNPQATQAADQSTDKLWHQAPKGLVSSESTESLEGPLDVAVDLTATYYAYHRLQEPSGRQGFHDQVVLSASGGLDFILNSEGTKGGGNPYRLGIWAAFEDADGDYNPNVGLLDYTRTGGMGYLDIRSSEPINGALSYHLRVGSGAAYVEWGKFSGVMWWSSLQAEVGYRLGQAGNFAIGPFAGFEGSAAIGEHSSALLDGNALVGIRAAGPWVRIQLSIVGVGKRWDANSVTGSYLKLQQERLGLGAQLKVWLGEALNFSLAYTRGKSRFTVNRAQGDVTDKAEDDEFTFGLGIIF